MLRLGVRSPLGPPETHMPGEDGKRPLPVFLLMLVTSCRSKGRRELEPWRSWPADEPHRTPDRRFLIRISTDIKDPAAIETSKVNRDATAPNPGRFVCAIVPSPVIPPRTLTMQFDRPATDGIADANSLNTGFTSRLPGTGTDLPARAANLRLNTQTGHLELTTTQTDINHQYRMPFGEHLGITLSKLGFTGTEDFEVSATIPNSPEIEGYGQFGLYAGTKSDQNIRGGIIKRGELDPGYSTQFMVNNNGEVDSDVHKVGLLSPGTDLRLTLKRQNGRYPLSITNLTERSSSTLSIKHPDSLGNKTGLFVGIFGANPYNDARKTVIIREFSITVWTVTEE